MVLPFPAKPLPTVFDGKSWFNHSMIRGNLLVEEKNTVIRTKNIRIKPNVKQIKIINNWFEIYREVYNFALKYFKSLKQKCSKITLRREVKSLFSNEKKRKYKKSGIPVHTIDNAIFDVYKAFKSSAALSKITKRPFRLRYKKQNCSKYLTLEKSSFGKKGIAFKSLGPMEAELDDFSIIEHDAKLIKQNSRYYLTVPVDVAKSYHSGEISCGIDPGLKTFQTIFDSSGKTTEISTDYRSRVENMFKKMDNLADFPEAKNRIKKMRKRIKNITKDLHYKAANLITANYKKIYIGNMSTRSIVMQDNFSKMNKRVLIAMSHYTFRMILKSVCEKRSCEFYEVDERYTSKTCGKCKNIKRDLGFARIYECPMENCGYVAGRDANAARNILIRGTA